MDLYEQQHMFSRTLISNIKVLDDPGNQVHTCANIRTRTRSSDHRLCAASRPDIMATSDTATDASATCVLSDVGTGLAKRTRVVAGKRLTIIWSGGRLLTSADHSVTPNVEQNL